MNWSTTPDYSAKIACRHPEVAIQTKNISFRDNNLHYLELFGFCNVCKKHVTFLGVPTARRDLAPSMTEDGVMIRLPFVCEGDNLKL